MKKLNIVFFSANRAEYGLIYPFLKIFLKHKMFNVELVVAGSHFSKKFGLSVKEIKKDKIKYFKINLPLNTNTLGNTSDYFNKLQNKVNLFLKKRKTDLVFLSSDRFETFAFAISTYLRKIPIIHYEGGDVTEGGALDDNIRHAITKISHIHLTSNNDSLKRILKMGEEKWRCLNVGYSPFYLMQKQKFNQKKIEKKFLLNHEKSLILFTFHPVVKDEKDQRKDVDEVFKALEHLSKDNQVIITYPNFDPGYQYIINKIIKLKKKVKGVRVIKHLGRVNYHSLLYYIGKNKKGFCMGNSSSGIKETIFFNCPTLNIGNRQKSRLKPRNVVDVKANKKQIIYKIYNGLNNYKAQENPYKLSRKFKKIPNEILKKFLSNDLKLKKCTI
ncbi:UDP-N-acetylglucosamine 2-epimerase [Candidatus Pelagibacter sp. HTCC7211]|uniref:UDP-N-acetylglucosamine 2-epimerase n=1 Tax=Pelagibacter sp. (strain HTCC7211) TaxID=439493 RepID=UPI000183AC94|nr:UDP-N-acetylglucosamine 2-epimerase [Candidatus Pelagibacter sp. HTCC7211]EDZ60576.1 UDP-N-acetylglucosamine 2-epimerase [Candidatus Pelagibacter sp. HTCC7211]MBD1151414.1 UDP-N-acetylglucosamine 2-epimerase (hydrolyzing) [Pelagibacterales bacterium SAG-MED25]